MVLRAKLDQFRFTAMVEYVRLISKDIFTRNWQSPETLVVLAVLVGIILLGYLIARK